VHRRCLRTVSTVRPDLLCLSSRFAVFNKLLRKKRRLHAIFTVGVSGRYAESTFYSIANLHCQPTLSMRSCANYDTMVIVVAVANMKKCVVMHGPVLVCVQVTNVPVVIVDGEQQKRRILRKAKSPGQRRHNVEMTRIARASARGGISPLIETWRLSLLLLEAALC